MKIKFSQSRLASIPLEPSGQKEYRDTELPGLVLRVSKTAKQYYVYVTVAGKLVKARIGDMEAYELTDARQEARRLIAELSGNPHALSRSKEKTTLSEGYEHYIREHILPNRTEKTYQNYRQLYLAYLRDLGSLKLSQVTEQEVRLLHRRLAKNNGVTVANRTLELLLALYNHCIDRNVYEGINPAHRVSKEVGNSHQYREQGRDVRLTSDQIATLVSVCRASIEAAVASKNAARAILIALTTGLRKESIMAFKAEWVADGWCVVPKEYVKGKRAPLRIPWPGALTLALQGSLESDCKDSKKAISTLMASAGLTGITLHSLRHVFASQGVDLGLGIEVVSVLLGHKLPGVTARYTHLSDGVLKSASDRIAGQVLDKEKPGTMAGLRLVG